LRLDFFGWFRLRSTTKKNINQNYLILYRRFKIHFKLFLNSFHKWRIRNIGNKTFLIISSGIIGVVAGLAAVLLKQLVHFVQWLLKSNFNLHESNILFFLYPILGILISVLIVQFFIKGKYYKGISAVLFSIFKKSSKLDTHHTWSHLLTSSITVSFGGSVGLEAPVVSTGSAIGSNIARVLRLGYKERTLLLGCGAAAGIAAIFNSPIAGVLFAYEVLLFQFTVPAFIPLLIASASAAIVSKLLYSGQLFFPVTEGWEFNAIPFYILLALVCGLISAYIIRMNHKIEEFFKTRKNIYVKILSGGITLGMLIFIFPPLFGEGYGTIVNLLNGAYTKILEHSLFYDFGSNPAFILIFVFVIILVKIFATAATIGSGGNGGIFAPSLFTGALTGFGFAFLINTTGLMNLNISNFIVVGMAGILSGVIHIPLTAIFLIAEITSGYVLFVPLMIVSALSFFISKYFEPYSVYTKILAEKGIVRTNDKEDTLISHMNLEELIESDFVILKYYDKFQILLNAISHSKRNIFPVTDDKGTLVGIVRLDDVREMMFETKLYDKVPVEEIMSEVQDVIHKSDNIRDVLVKFQRTETWNLPVVEEGTYIGFVSKSRLLDDYRTLFVSSSKELI